MKKPERIVAAIAFLFMFGMKYLPSILGLKPVGMATMGIFIGTVLLLLGVNLVWPVFLCVLAFAINGIYPLNDAIRMCFGNSVFWFMMINGVVIGAIEKTGLFRRIALWISSRPIARKNPWLFLLLFVFSCLFCGSIMNTTAVYLLFLALGTEIMHQCGLKKGDPTAAVFMMTVMAAANISHAITPFGHSITIMSIEYFAAYDGLNFLSYSLVGYLCAVIGLILMMFILHYVFHYNISTFSNLDLDILRNSKPMTVQEKTGTGIMGFIIIWWISPAFLQNAAPEVSSFMNSNLGITTPLIIAMFVLCILKSDGKPMLNMTEGIQTAPWIAGIVVAVSLFLGSALQNKEAGIIENISGAIAPVCEKMPPFLFVIIITMVVMLMSNFTSCTLSLMIGGIVTVTLFEGGVIQEISGGALSLALTFAAQAAFATPPASAPAAICAGEGWIKPRDQIFGGFVFAGLWWFVGIIGYGICSMIR